MLKQHAHEQFWPGWLANTQRLSMLGSRHTIDDHGDDLCSAVSLATSDGAENFHEQTRIADDC